MHNSLDKNFKLLISEVEISRKIQELTTQINHDYADQSVTVVAILKGSFIFVADLVRSLTIDVERIEFLQLASYGEKTTSSGDVSLLLKIAPSLITNKHILLVEDIIDTGLSLHTAIDTLQNYQPASLKICTFLDKPSRRQKEIKIDYCGFQIPDHFVVGYGLDYNQKYRHLPAIYCSHQLSDDRGFP